MQVNFDYEIDRPPGGLDKSISICPGEFNTLWTAATTGREFYRVDGMSTLLEVPVSKPVVISKPVLSALGAGSGSSLGLHMVGAGAKYVNPTVLYNQVKFTE